MSRFKGWLYCIQHVTCSYSKPGRRMSTAKNVISGGRATEEHHITLCVQFWPSGTPVADADCLVQRELRWDAGGVLLDGRCSLLGAGSRLRRTGKMFLAGEGERWFRPWFDG
jgi:hypothetical protein